MYSGNITLSGSIAVGGGCGAERRNVVGCGAGTGGSRIPHIITTAIVTIDAAAKIAKHAPYISSVIFIPIKVECGWYIKV